MSNWNRGFAGGILLGIALGGFLAVLYAPERGDKTRKRLAKKGGKWLDETTDQFGKTMGKKVEKSLENASELVEKGRKRIGL